MSRQAELINVAGRTRVVAGILQNEDGKILIADRSRAQTLSEFWEFPGGKVNQDETPDDALRRELKEELGIAVQGFSFFESLEHDYPDLSVRLDFYVVSDWYETPVGREGQRIRWVDKRSLDRARLLPADAPLVDSILRKL